jgi:hypothetical protein
MIKVELIEDKVEISDNENNVTPKEQIKVLD